VQNLVDKEEVQMDRVVMVPFLEDMVEKMVVVVIVVVVMVVMVVMVPFLEDTEMVMVVVVMVVVKEMEVTVRDRVDMAGGKVGKVGKVGVVWVQNLVDKEEVMVVEVQMDRVVVVPFLEDMVEKMEGKVDVMVEVEQMVVMEE